MIQHRRKDVVAACKKSLQRLGRENIELYQIHFPGAFNNKEFWDGLADCYEQGLVRSVGVSNYGVEALSAVWKELKQRGVPLASNQIQYSLLYRYPEENDLKAWKSTLSPSLSLSLSLPPSLLPLPLSQILHSRRFRCCPVIETTASSPLPSPFCDLCSMPHSPWWWSVCRPLQEAHG